jgi:hypothetical protein
VWKDIIKKGSSKNRMGGSVNWRDLFQVRDKWQALVDRIKTL